MSDLLIAYRHLHWESRNTVRTVYHEVLRSLVAQVGQGRTHMYLDTLSHTLRYLHVVLAAHVLLDVGCEVVTSGTDGVVAHDTTE